MYRIIINKKQFITNSDDTDKPFLNEFAVKTKLDIDELQEYCNEEYLQCGLKIADDTLLIAVTETYSREDCDDLVDACVTFNEEKEGK